MTLHLNRVAEIPKPRGTVRNIAWSPDGTALAFEQRAGVFVHELGQVTTVVRPMAVGTADIAWSRDGETLLCLIRSRDEGGGNRYEVLTYERSTGEVVVAIDDDTCDWPQMQPVWLTSTSFAVPHRSSDHWSVFGDVPETVGLRTFYYTAPRTENREGYSDIMKATLNPQSGTIHTEIVPLPLEWDAKLWWLIDTIPGLNHLFVTAMDREQTRRAVVTDAGLVIREFDASVAYWTDVSGDGRYAVGRKVRQGGHGTGSGDTGDLWLLRLADGASFRLMHTPQDLEHKPYFAPDGRRIAWSTRNQIVIDEIRGMP